MLAQKRSWPRGNQYDGLVTASSYCGLTSSCIERCSCCVPPPNGQLVGKLGLDIHSRRGPLFLFCAQLKVRRGSRKKAVVRPIIFLVGLASPFAKRCLGTKVKNSIDFT